MNASSEFDGVADETTARYHHLLIRSQPGLEIIINSMPSMAIVLNHAHQIVYANKAFLGASVNSAGDQAQIERYFSEDSDCLWNRLLGLRMGDALGCIHADGETCGHTPACKHCGIWKALNGYANEKKTDPLICRLQRKGAEAQPNQTLLFNVSVTPLKILHWDFLLLVLSDISSEVHCSMLEHVLFHDIRDLTEGITSIVGTLREKKPASAEELQRIYQVLGSEAAQASGELAAHQQLFRAERGELIVHPVELKSLDVLKSSISAFENQQPGKGVHVALDRLAVNTRLETDEILLSRILRSMLCSAMETAGPGDCIVAGCRAETFGIEFFVRQPSALPGELHSQLFARSFTAKDTKFGTDTYAMKLIGESYLGGTVACSSDSEEGTEFTISLPADYSKA